MGLAIKKQDHKYTYKDYLGWPDDERWELIGGVAFDMSPAPLVEHQNITGELFAAIKNFLKNKKCKVFVSPIDVFISDRKDDKDELIENVVQPDIIVVCDQSKVEKKGIRGAPDMVIEVLSTSTAKKDWNEKYNLYEKHGVREYWIVDPSNKAVYIYQLNDKGVFVEKVILEEKGIAECFVLEGLKINIEEIFV